VGGEVVLAQAEQRRAIHLGRATDKIMDARLERLVVAIMPDVAGNVAIPDEDFVHVPVLFFARQIVATFKDQDAFAQWRELECQRAATCAATDDDHVVVIVIAHSWSSLGVAAVAAGRATGSESNWLLPG
jgi:hypothetical protein